MLEPRCVGAPERYVDLSPGYNLAAIKARAGELRAQTEAYRASYGEAYHVLRALGSVDAQRRALAHADFDGEKLLRRAAGIAARELRGRGDHAGRTADVFLGGLTCQGLVCRFDSVDALCPRIYELCDSYGLAVPMLRLLHAAATEAGLDVLVGRDPLRPELPAHLIVPARGLAFLTTGDGTAYEGKPYRRLRIDALAEEPLTRAQKAHLRFLRRIRRALEEEAVAALVRAKQGHDALEAVYRPCVDFAVSEALCAREIARIAEYERV